MSKIGNTFHICLAYTGKTYYDDCGGLLQETGDFLKHRKLVLTDGQIDPFEADPKLRNAAKGTPKAIFLEDCETTSITFPCNEPTDTVDQGKFVDLVNTCTEPITVTGMTNSDPTRFTIFDLGYRGYETYWSGTVSEIPFTISPYTKMQIPSFFHPSRTEIEDGNAGSYENRTGDSWSAKISMYPGFPILGCENMDPCDSFYTLSGELLCEEKKREPLKNIGNYQGVYGCDVEAFDGMEASECIITSGVYVDTVEPGYDSFTAMQDLSVAVKGEFNDPKDPPDDSMYAGACLFQKAIFKSSDYLSLLSTDFVSYTKTPRQADGSVASKVEDYWDVTGMYLGQNVKVNYGDELYTGMRVSVRCDEGGPFINDVGVFFNQQTLANGKSEHAIFLAEWGDFANTSFCFSQSNVELETVPYEPITDIQIWSKNKASITSPGSQITSVSEERIGRVGYMRATK